jgi:hypothetical protein
VLVSAVVQVVSTKAGALLVLARVTRLRPNSQEDLTRASRLYYLRLAPKPTAAPQQ